MDNINAPATPNNQNVTLPMNEFLELKLQQAQRSHQHGVPPAQGQATGMGMAVVPPHGWPPGPGPMPIATAVPWHAGNNQMQALDFNKSQRWPKDACWQCSRREGHAVPAIACTCGNCINGVYVAYSKVHYGS